MNALESIESLQDKIANSELGREWNKDPLMTKDIWSVSKLGYTQEDLIRGVHNLYFEGFSLPWLKLLAKLTTRASAREKCALDTTGARSRVLRQLDEFLVSKNCYQIEWLTNSLLLEFISKNKSHKRQAVIRYAINLWNEEGWIKLNYVSPIYKKSTPKIEVIPEEILHQVYQNFSLFPLPLERLFKLQLVLGCRINEIMRMPRQYLKQEGEKWFLLRWVAKRKFWKFQQIHPSVAELVRSQQKFLDDLKLIGNDFDKLFCMTYAAHSGGFVDGTRFDREPVYLAKPFSAKVIQSWLQDFSVKANLVDKHNNKFNLTTHHFRRTKASIMAYCEAEDEYIAAVLGHASLDMLCHYRQRDLNRLEKEAANKKFVDMYGKISTFKPKKQRYEKLAEILKVETSLGECHRPIMLGDCEYRYACLSCSHHRVTLDDKSWIENDIDRLTQDLEVAKAVGQERRIIEIERLLKLLNTRLNGLISILNS